MSRTYKDIKTKYLSIEEQQERTRNAKPKVREYLQKKNAISFELNLIELDELSAELQSAINNYINN